MAHQYKVIGLDGLSNDTIVNDLERPQFRKHRFQGHAII